jgi:pseudouridine synthase
MPLPQAQDAIAAGRVQLDSRSVVEPMSPVTATSRVSVDGKPVSLAWRTRVLMLHKPQGVVSHGSDPEGIGTVFDALLAALPPELLSFGWHAVGRLDRDTTGLLLFTNDERFVAHATAPATHLPKRYVAKVGTKVKSERLEPLRVGVVLDDGLPTRPAKARPHGDDEVELILTEGRFHQVKRMLNAVGLPTLGLHRAAVGTLELDVAVGTLRQVTDDEVRRRLGFEPRRGLDPAAGA